MTIENRNLTVGTNLVAKYKKQTYGAEVIEGEGDKVLYRLEDGRVFKSPSAAGSAIMDGKACNGWRFWGLDEDQEQSTSSDAEPEPESEPVNESPTKARVIRKLPNQKGLPDGAVRFYCDTCKESFVSAAPDESPACPKGHSNPEEAGS